METYTKDKIIKHLTGVLDSVDNDVECYVLTLVTAQNSMSIASNGSLYSVIGMLENTKLKIMTEGVKDGFGGQYS